MFCVLMCVDHGRLLREGFEWNGLESGGLQESRRRVGQRRLRFFPTVQRRRLRWRHVRPEKPRPFPGGGRIRDNGRPGCVVLPEHMGWVVNSFCGGQVFLMRKIFNFFFQILFENLKSVKTIMVNHERKASDDHLIYRTMFENKINLLEDHFKIKERNIFL